MKKNLTILLFVLASSFCFAQEITQPPSGDNQRASVSQNIGMVTVTIHYSSPDIHGPDGADRTGHIWGELCSLWFLLIKASDNQKLHLGVPGPMKILPLRFRMP